MGVDTEPIMLSETASLINGEIATQAEVDLLKPLDLSNESALTLIFSAKESFYKCWHPLNNRFLDFLDVAVIAATDSTLSLQLAVPSNDADAQSSELTVCYHLTDEDVFTFATLEGKQ